MRAFKDDRGRSYNDLFSGKEQDINCSVLYPNAIKAWHMHERQTDFWACAKGHLKASVVSGTPEKYVRKDHYLSEGDTLIIPAGLWHGVHNISEQESILLYQITPKYDPENPDELRVDWKEFGAWKKSRK